jgi:hypothetical protein
MLRAFHLSAWMTFERRKQLIAFIQKIEPETPRISLGGRSPQHVLGYAEYLASLRNEGVPSAMQIYEMEKRTRGELIIDELSEDDLRGA